MEVYTHLPLQLMKLITDETKSLSISDTRSFSLHSLPPIPRINQNLTDPTKIHKAIIIRACKNFSKVSAVGPHTLKSLKSIRMSRTIKTIRKFEFDPYLCEVSCLRSVESVIPKLKTVKDINFVIRRLDDDDNDRCIMFNKIRRLIKFRSEIVHNGEDWKNKSFPPAMIQAIKCYSLKTLDFVSLDVPFVPNKLANMFLKFRRNLQKLEEYNLTKYHSYMVTGAEQNGVSCSLPTFRLNKLKKISFSYGVKPGWISISENMENNFFFLECFKKSFGVESVSLKFIKYPSVFDLIAELIKLLPNLPVLRKLGLEFMSSQIGDIEVAQLIKALIKLPSIKHFSLKIYQYPNISGEMIYYMTEMILKHSSIEKFDLCVKSLDMFDDQIDSLVTELSRNKQVTCSRFKQSFYVSLNQTK